MSDKPDVLRFGIPSLDELLGDTREGGIQLSSPEEVLSIAIEGSDGTGKSVLAFHLASYFAARDIKCDHGKELRVVYVSTDLNFDRAQSMWAKFALGRPRHRTVDPFRASPEYLNSLSEVPIALEEYEPLKEENRQKTDIKEERYIGFLDLASRSSGDEWGMINRLLASWPKDKTPFMLVIDAIEGLETWVGERDAFGEPRRRRSRIAQLLRTARHKCHVVFLVETTQLGRKAPEEFVTDVVIHVRQRSDGDYSQRTIEVEKVRGQTHARGQHDLAIRSGEGSKTSGQVNPDDPVISQLGNPEVSELDALKPDMPNVSSQSKDRLKETRVPQSYFYVFQSLHRQSRRYMEQQSSPFEEQRSTAVSKFLDLRRYAGFGIQYLDEMFGHDEEQGLPTDVATALIGQNATFKSVLGRAFLSQSFADENDAGVAVLITTRDISRSDLINRIGWRHCPRIVENGEVNPAQDARRRTEQHAEKIFEWLNDPSIRNGVSRNTSILCRRLEVHHLSSAVLAHIITRVVQRAQELMIKSLPDDAFADAFPGVRQEERKAFTEEKKFLEPEFLLARRRLGWRVRVVIENWSVIEETYPEVRDDPRFLPFLLAFLQREGIAALFIATEAGSAAAILAPRQPSRLRDLVPHHLYTWHVAFFGVSRVAITVVPPISTDRLVLVRELKPRAITRTSQRMRQRERELARNPMETEDLLVSPEFELYTGLATGNPRPIPLKVNLYLETGAFRNHVDELNGLLSRMMVGGIGDNVVEAVDAAEYEHLREYSNLQSGTRLDHTLLFQVDEFWAESSIQLCSLTNYMKEETVRKDGKANVVSDPFLVFQKSQADATRVDDKWKKGPLSRLDFFETVGHNYANYEKNKWTIDKVPYLWDFGFLLCRYHKWESAANSSTADVKDVVRPVWDRLNRWNKKGDDAKSDSVSWEEFFAACRKVAEHASCRDGKSYLPFDISMVATESFSCLIMEIWASLIKKKLGTDEDKRKTIFPQRRHERDYGMGLLELLSDYSKELQEAWKRFAGVTSRGQFPTGRNYFQPRPADPMAVAARHWYSTAAVASKVADSADPLIPISLPGSYSIRGDWFLAVAEGSRSLRLGERAMDILCSRRGNIIRCQTGIGLPVRDTEFQTKAELWTPLLKPIEGGGPADFKTMDYEDMLKLGARGNPDSFYWLWRSLIRNYDRHSRVWQRWLCSILTRNWDLVLNEDSAGFEEECKGLVARLERATFATGKKNPPHVPGTNIVPD